jgi:hypothetical protein
MIVHRLCVTVAAVGLCMAAGGLFIGFLNSVVGGALIFGGLATAVVGLVSSLAVAVALMWMDGP